MASPNLCKNPEDGNQDGRLGIKLGILPGLEVIEAFRKETFAMEEGTVAKDKVKELNPLVVESVGTEDLSEDFADSEAPQVESEAPISQEELTVATPKRQIRRPALQADDVSGEHNQVGERAVSIDGDANNSVNVTGNHNQVIVIKEAEAEKIARLLPLPATAQTVSVNELVQQVRSRASTKILNLFSKIRLLNKRQIEVERLYVDVYVLEKQDFRATIPGLLEGRDAREQFDRFGLGKRREQSPGLAITASENYPRLMVLGKPGSGKSTFLRYLAVGCAKGEFLGDYIPVLLELRDVDEATFSLVQWIHEEFELEQEAQTEQILKRGQVLILLDGLDEVPSSLQHKVQNELRKFAKRYNKNRFILTCRTQTTEYIPEQFQAVEVEDFNPEQVESFALNWFTAMAETLEKGVETQKRFIERLRKTPQAAELAITPVLLSLTCWIFDDLKCLPEKRSDLYRDGLDLLLQQWDEGRGISRDSGCDRYRQLTLEERKRLLSYLAFRKFEQAENFVLFEELELCGYIAEYLQISVEESRAVLQAIAQQHGLLIERAQRIWSFSHLTFQEYLVAKYFLEKATWADLVKHIREEYWREVFLLSAESIKESKEADKLLTLMKEETDRIIPANATSQNFLIWVNQRTNSLEEIEAPFKPEAVRAFYFDFRISQPFSLLIDLPFISTLDTYFSSYVTLSLSKAISATLDFQIEQHLREIRQQQSYHQYEKWWQSNSHLWIDQLRNIMNEAKNFSTELFDSGEFSLLQKYYYANKLLVACLYDCCVVSDYIQDKIKKAFLLPIAEIEKRKNQNSD